MPTSDSRTVFPGLARREGAPGRDRTAGRTRERLDSGIEPAEVADRVVGAIREERFYVLTHPATPAAVRAWAEGVADGRGPVP
jgi:hypothetical protein